jgi:MarR family 2-MHQ and catechol resistance regulon transcriptional repressor
MSTRLQQELKKKQPFNVPSQAAALGLVRTNDRLQIQFARLFRQYGLTPSQYNVLRILRGEGAPLPILEIAERTVTVVPGITGLIDRLEAAGLVSRERSSEDRRVIYVALTDKATKLLAKIDRPLVELHERLMGHLSKTELNDLIRLLDKVRAGLPADEV